MRMRNFSHYTYDSYMRKTKEMMVYFNKSLEKVTIDELRDYLYKYLLNERKMADKTVNYYRISNWIWGIAIYIYRNRRGSKFLELTTFLRKRKERNTCSAPLEY